MFVCLIEVQLSQCRIPNRCRRAWHLVRMYVSLSSLRSSTDLKTPLALYSRGEIRYRNRYNPLGCSEYQTKTKDVRAKKFKSQKRKHKQSPNPVMASISTIQQPDWRLFIESNCTQHSASKTRPINRSKAGITCMMDRSWAAGSIRYDGPAWAARRVHLLCPVLVLGEMGPFGSLGEYRQPCWSLVMLGGKGRRMIGKEYWK